MTYPGAQALLDLDLMSHLSKCSIFDLRPEHDQLVEFKVFSLVF